MQHHNVKGKLFYHQILPDLCVIICLFPRVKHITHLCPKTNCLTMHLQKKILDTGIWTSNLFLGITDIKYTRVL